MVFLFFCVLSENRSISQFFRLTNPLSDGIIRLLKAMMKKSSAIQALTESAAAVEAAQRRLREEHFGASN